MKLVPLEEEHIHPLYNCSRDPEIWTHYPYVIKTLEEMTTFVHKAMDCRERKEQYPYAVYDKERQEYVGTTRFLRISEENKNLNIGTTWFSPTVWRTSVNTECKFLMLQYAFEMLEVVRVEIVTTTDNVRSQKAIERLGATKEGILRRKYYNLDYVIYSIIFNEWPEIKINLKGKLL
ncbi:GNAT family N-acetyltransferase [Paenibacillus paeoniae]|uniref:GNAT family N-acetyltransferase n=1 Tax=Paenibacillus paeoniae TaxID=2292705 RepID=UPI001402F358|nr:GNAT family N-acetyltransferase [Paenibacillus paeoniae]